MRTRKKKKEPEEGVLIELFDKIEERGYSPPVLLNQLQSSLTAVPEKGLPRCLKECLNDKDHC